jgi:hypothetical protein
LTNLDTLARRYPEQVCGTPNDIGFKSVHAPIDINYLPHHFNDLAASFSVERLIDLTGELIEVNSASFGRNSVADQLGRGEIVETEARFKNVILSA